MLLLTVPLWGISDRVNLVAMSYHRPSLRPIFYRR